MHTAIISAGICVGLILMFIAGFVFGLQYRKLFDRIEELQESVESKDDGSAIIDITPQQVEQRQYTASLQEEQESQVITVKSPRQIAADKAKHEREVLDKITNGAIRS